MGRSSVDFSAGPDGSSRLSRTPKGHAGTQYPQPLQMSSWTTTVPYSVRKSEPVGQTSRQAAWVQCLQTSELISQRSAYTCSSPSGSTCKGSCCSTNATWRHEFAPSSEVLSYDSPVQTIPSSGTRFHSLQATSHALQPMQIDVSVKKPTRGGCSGDPALPATSSSGPNRLCSPVTCSVMARRRQMRAGLGRDPRAPSIPLDVL